MKKDREKQAKESDNSLLKRNKIEKRENKKRLSDSDKKENENIK